MRSAGALMTRVRRRVSVPSLASSAVALVAPTVTVLPTASGGGAAAFEAGVVVFGLCVVVLLLAMSSGLQVLGQGVEGVLPEEAVLHKPAEGGRERAALEGAAPHPSVGGLLEQAGLLE